MPAVLPLFAIVAVFIFISAHAATTSPPRRRKTDYRYSRSGYRDSGGSYSSYGGERSGGRSNRSSGGRKEHRYSDRGRY